MTTKEEVEELVKSPAAHAARFRGCTREEVLLAAILGNLDTCMPGDGQPPCGHLTDWVYACTNCQEDAAAQGIIFPTLKEDRELDQRTAEYAAPPWPELQEIALKVREARELADDLGPRIEKHLRQDRQIVRRLSDDVRLSHDLMFAATCRLFRDELAAVEGEYDTH